MWKSVATTLGTVCKNEALLLSENVLHQQIRVLELYLKLLNSTKSPLLDNIHFKKEVPRSVA